jgi:hypothetical protein
MRRGQHSSVTKRMARSRLESKERAGYGLIRYRAAPRGERGSLLNLLRVMRHPMNEVIATMTPAS